MSNDFTWQDVMNTIQNMSPEQMNQPVRVNDCDGDSMTVNGISMETWRVNGHCVQVPVMEF
jgi:hypothetical protein